MFRLQGKLPEQIYVACSGGVDSMAAVDFLRNNHIVTLLYLNHGDDDGYAAEEFLKEYFSGTKKLPIHFGYVSRGKNKEESQEEYWRNERYSFFDYFINAPIITTHHLDDCVETWIWSSLHGEGKIIPYSRGNVIRPFRLNRKAQFGNWCRAKQVPWYEETTNSDPRFMRNFIRQEIMPKALVVNPGLHKVVAKKVEKDYNNG